MKHTSQSISFAKCFHLQSSRWGGIDGGRVRQRRRETYGSLLVTQTGSRFVTRWPRVRRKPPPSTQRDLKLHMAECGRTNRCTTRWGYRSHLKGPGGGSRGLVGRRCWLEKSHQLGIPGPGAPNYFFRSRFSASKKLQIFLENPTG